MINQNSQFFAILTNVGVAKQANADALGVSWKITQMAVGDANDTDPVPNATQTKLVNERRRAPLNQLKVDPANAAIIIAEQVIPAEVGGWWIREIGLYDADGDLVAIANCAPSFKPLLTQGSGRTQVVRINLLVSNSSSVELKIDPSVVLATRKYVDDSIINVLPANKKAGIFSRVTVNSRGIVQSGDNPATLEENGITDAYTKMQVDLLVAQKLTAAEGRLLGVRVITTSGIYTPTPGTKSVIVDLCGGSGSSGGTAATAASTIAQSGGGAGGAYARSRYTSGFAGLMVTIGLGGAAPAAGNNTGLPGGATSFGNLMTAPGGPGGAPGPAVPPVQVTLSNGIGPAPTGANICGKAGDPATSAFVYGDLTSLSSRGGSSQFGTGGHQPSGSGGRAGDGYGAGPSGVYARFSQSAQPGVAGNQGVAMIWEYA